MPSLSSKSLLWIALVQYHTSNTPREDNPGNPGEVSPVPVLLELRGLCVGEVGLRRGMVGGACCVGWVKGPCASCWWRSCERKRGMWGECGKG